MLQRTTILTKLINTVEMHASSPPSIYIYIANVVVALEVDQQQTKHDARRRRTAQPLFQRALPTRLEWERSVGGDMC